MPWSTSGPASAPPAELLDDTPPPPPPPPTLLDDALVTGLLFGVSSGLEPHAAAKGDTIEAASETRMRRRMMRYSCARRAAVARAQLTRRVCSRGECP